MQLYAGWTLITVSAVTSLYVWHVTNGEVRYIMFGPALLGMVLLYRHWRDN